MNYTKRKRWHAYLWILPALLCMLIIQFIPGIFAIFISFTKMDVNYISDLFRVPMAGLDNYFSIFAPGHPVGNAFLNSLFVTLRFTLFSTVLAYLLGLGGSLMLNVKFPGRGLIRGLFLIPWIVPGVVSNVVWRMMFLKEYGIINKFFRLIGLIEENIYWLYGEHALWSLVIARTWSTFPFVAISLLAALQTIPQDTYEAATIDGAGGLQRFRYITLPGISTVSKVVVLLMFIWGSSEFNAPYIIFATPPLPPQASTLSILIYEYAFKLWDFGSGSAMATILLLIMMVIAGVYMKITIKDNAAS